MQSYYHQSWKLSQVKGRKVQSCRAETLSWSQRAQREIDYAEFIALTRTVYYQATLRVFKFQQNTFDGSQRRAE